VVSMPMTFALAQLRKQRGPTRRRAVVLGN
jgi:hypothetical protein